MFAINLIPWKTRAPEGEAEGFAPTSSLARFRSEMDRLFDRFLSGPFGRPELASMEPGWPMKWMPSLDVTESDDEVFVRAELPGVDPKKIDISVSGDLLTLSGEKKQEKEEKRGSYYHVERSFGSFRRSVRLPSSVDRDAVSAEFENGVLTIRMRKAEVEKPKRVPISVATS